MATIVTQDASLHWSGVRLVLLKQRCQAMLEEVARVAGVQGACVCDNHGAVLAMLRAGTGDRRLFEELGLAVSQCLVALQARSPVKDLEFLFERRRVFARDLGHALAVLVCSTGVNPALLRMTLSVASSPLEADTELQRALKQAALSRAQTLDAQRVDALGRALLEKAGVQPS